MIPEFIILHHSATPDGRTFSWGAIRDYHIRENHWRDIGYHFGIELVGEHYEVLWGRMPYEPGAHCTANNMNSRSLGICCVGNFNDAPPPDPQWQLALTVVRHLASLYKIAADRVLGHRETGAPKDCPGLQFNMGLFRSPL